MGCNRCRHGRMDDPMFENDRYNDRDRFMPFPGMDRRHMRRREFFDRDDFRRRRDFFDTDDFRRRRRGRTVIIGFPRFF